MSTCTTIEINVIPNITTTKLPSKTKKPLDKKLLLSAFFSNINLNTASEILNVSIGTTSCNVLFNKSAKPNSSELNEAV